MPNVPRALGRAARYRDRPMKGKLLLCAGLVAVWLSCETPPAPEPTPTPEFPDNWHAIMEEVIGYQFDEVLAMESDKQPRDMDLASVESAATNMARAMALGYGPLELPEVEGFGGYARRSEQWLLEIAAAARAGDGAKARRMIIDGQFANCEDCHDASDDAGIGK